MKRLLLALAAFSALCAQAQDFELGPAPERPAKGFFADDAPATILKAVSSVAPIDPMNSAAVVAAYNTYYNVRCPPKGSVGRVLNNPGQFNGITAVPYYRLYDTSTQWHHWTTDANEYYTLGLFPSWTQEGVDGWILPTNTAGATQLYRLLYPFVAGLHHWTIDANEYNVLTTSFGWIGEGGAGFAIQ